MSSARKHMKKMQPADKPNKKTFNDRDEELRDSEDEDVTVLGEKPSKKRPSSDVPVGSGFQSMLEQFGVDISNVVQAKMKRLEILTKNYMKGSQHKVVQLWSTHQSQRQKLTQQYEQQVSTALQQLEADGQRGEEQEETMNNLFKQQIKILQQARATQSQKLKAIRELYEVFVKNTEEMQKSHEAFVQGAMQELKEEMNTLQKKILMDTQQQEMANVRKSLQSVLF